MTCIPFLFASLVAMGCGEESSCEFKQPTLLVGSKAPALSIETWVKGTPIWSFEPGKIHVVEFWATWCPSCIRSIPHLSELQARYRNGSVTIIAVAASERGSDPAQRLGAVKEFVAERGEKMAYTVGFDADRSMHKNWMEPSRQTGIPTAFVVDRNGIIAWIGHPLEMDAPLAQIVAGTWDVKAASAKFQRDVEAEAKAAPLLGALSRAMKDENWSKALEQIDAVLALGSEQFDYLRGDRFRLLLTRMGQPVAAYAYARETMAAAPARADILNAIAWAIVDPNAKVEKRDLDLALQAAEGANRIAQDREPSYLDTLARVHAAKGDFSRAIELQTRALNLVTGDDRALYEKTLAEYKAKKGS
jgi:thiol-disulfide isomerase/thioredoxin